MPRLLIECLPPAMACTLTDAQDGRVNNKVSALMRFPFFFLSEEQLLIKKHKIIKYI